jgi:ABC-type transporter Mla MlaB component
MGVSAVRFVVRATIARADIPALCARLADLLRGRAGDVVECDVTGVGRPDVVTVEAVARLRLTARRHGSRLVVTGAGQDMLTLFALLGLTELLAPDGPGPAAGSSEAGPAARSSEAGPAAHGSEPEPAGGGSGEVGR